MKGVQYWTVSNPLKSVKFLEETVPAELYTGTRGGVSTNHQKESDWSRYGFFF
jgi:hypothetical protein